MTLYDMFGDSNADLIKHYRVVTAYNFTKYFLISFNFYILTFVIIFVCFATYLAGSKDRLDKKNREDIKHKVFLLATFFELPAKPN